MRGAEGLGVGIGMFSSFNDRVALGGLNAGEENQALSQVNDSGGETKESFFEIEDPLLPGALVQPTNLSPRSIGCWMFSVGCWMFSPVHALLFCRSPLGLVAESPGRACLDSRFFWAELLLTIEFAACVARAVL